MVIFGIAATNIFALVLIVDQRHGDAKPYMTLIRTFQKYHVVAATKSR